MPTLRQQAELFIRSLRLGTNADEPTDNSATTPTTQPLPRTSRPPPRTTQPLPRTTRPTPRPTRPTPRPTRPTQIPFLASGGPLWTIPPSLLNITFNPYRGRRDIPVGSYYCPSHEKQANNRICPNVCPRGTYVRQLPVSLIKVTVQSPKHLNYCETFG